MPNTCSPCGSIQSTATGTPTGKPSPSNAALPPMTTARTNHYAAPPERITLDRARPGAADRAGERRRSQFLSGAPCRSLRTEYRLASRFRSISVRWLPRMNRGIPVSPLHPARQPLRAMLKDLQEGNRTRYSRVLRNAISARIGHNKGKRFLARSIRLRSPR